MVNLSIVILSYNTKALTVKCIDSIIKQYNKQLEKGEIEIVVVDNASTDDSVLSIKKQVLSMKNLHMIENKENFGFAKGCNAGAKESKGKYLLFLNSDTQVLDDGFLRMIEFLEGHNNVGILGGKLLDPNGYPQASTGKFYTLQNLFLMLAGLERFGVLRESPKEIKQVDWVSGGCLMIKHALFDKLEGFDEHFFMYVEDMELCFRAKKNNLLVYFYPDVKVVHRELGSSNRSFAITHIYEGILYFYKKHKSYWQYILAKFLLTLKANLMVLIGNAVNNNYLKNTYKEALRF